MLIAETPHLLWSQSVTSDHITTHVLQVTLVTR